MTHIDFYIFKIETNLIGPIKHKTWFDLAQFQWFIDYYIYPYLHHCFHLYLVKEKIVLDASKNHYFDFQKFQSVHHMEQMMVKSRDWDTHLIIHIHHLPLIKIGWYSHSHSNKHIIEAFIKTSKQILESFFLSYRTPTRLKLTSQRFNF